MTFVHLSIFFFLVLFLFFINTPARLIESVSKKEIKEISSQIWQADKQRLSELDVSYIEKGPRLFTHVNEKQIKGTYRLLEALFDNYEYRIGIPEKSSPQKEREIDAFLNAILLTPPITILHDWLGSKGLADKNVTKFKKDLYKYWFAGYSRSGNANIKDSSGFEHVFLGEVNEKKKKVIGFHNWLFAYEQEKKGHFVHKNHTRTCPNDVISLNFEWMSYNKPITSISIRSSPQLELSLYTLCFLARHGNSCGVTLGNKDHSITTHIHRDKFTDFAVATAYIKC